MCKQCQEEAALVADAASASPTPPLAGLEFYREQLRHCCGEQGTPEGGFCESWGCSSVVDLLAMADAAERRAAFAIALAEEKNVYWQIAQTGEARVEVITKTQELAAAARENEQANADIVTLTNLLDSVGRAAARENERLRDAVKYLIDANETWVEITHCECDPCLQCGKMPKECTGTDCARGCSCNECPTCHSEAAIATGQAALAAEPGEEG